MTELKAYFVWDANVRWFHWINVLCILGLVALGTVILNASALGVSTEGKILLKTVHVWFGYAFAVNLLWRLIWAFIGGPHARWRSILPGGQGYRDELRAYLADFKAGRPRQYLGHNPLGRIAVTLLLFVLVIQAITGLVLAGTDIFYPPLGAWIASWIAAPGVDPATLMPYAKEMYDAAAYESMRAFRDPFITLHYYSFYTLLGLIVLHIVAVVITEIREGGNLISAMFTGKKVLSKIPADLTKKD
ncbi:MAG: cytochrome b/b6 domain-containing protein [Gammaproteobacteria bacterium]|nr:cytochrome b/b6 domain-containing protein [Gammaproteobacteria bacterium]